MTDISSINLISRTSFNFKIVLAITSIILFSLIISSLAMTIYNYENVVKKQGSSNEKTIYWVSALLLGIGILLIIGFLIWSIISLIPQLETADDFLTDMTRISTAGISSKDLRGKLRNFLISKTGNPDINDQQIIEFANYLKGKYNNFNEASQAGVNYPNFLRRRIIKPFPKLTQASYRGGAGSAAVFNSLFETPNNPLGPRNQYGDENTTERILQGRRTRLPRNLAQASYTGGAGSATRFSPVFETPNNPLGPRNQDEEEIMNEQANQAALEAGRKAEINEYEISLNKVNQQIRENLDKGVTPTGLLAQRRQLINILERKRRLI